MPESEVTTVLPDRDEMLSRLLEVSDEKFLQKYFYPELLKIAGNDISPSYLVLRFIIEIHDCTKDIHKNAGTPLILLIPVFIDALIDDKCFAEEAKSYLMKP